MILVRIFFAGPLTNLVDKEGTKAFYKQMAEVAEVNGFEHYWAFLHGTDPVRNPKVSPQKVYATDIRELGKSDLMIAYVGEPTTGTGQEIEFAKQRNIPVYLIFEKGTHVTRMTLGSPNIKGLIVFTGKRDGLSKLDALLKTLRK